MKKMRLLIACSLFAFASLLAVPAFAQGGGGTMQQQSPADWAKAHAATAKTALSLSDADEAKMIGPLTTYRDATMKAMQAAMAGGAQMSADDRAKMADQLKKDLVAAGFSEDVATKIVANVSTGRGRGRGGF